MGPLNSAIANATQVTNKIAFAISNMSSEAYTHAPLTYGLFHTAAVITPNNKWVGKRKENPQPPKDAKPSEPKAKKANNKHEANKKLGLLTFSGPGRLPNCNYTFKHHTNGSKARLCLGHNFQDRFCRWDRCNFVHVSKLSDLTTDDKDALIQYVNDNSDIAFASGKGPSSGTA